MKEINHNVTRDKQQHDGVLLWKTFRISSTYILKLYIIRGYMELNYNPKGKRSMFTFISQTEWERISNTLVLLYNVSSNRSYDWRINSIDNMIKFFNFFE